MILFTRILLGLIIVSAIMIPTTSTATVYECHTKQVLRWLHGTLVPDVSSIARKDEILRFDEDLGILSAAYDEEHSFGASSPVDIIHRTIDTLGNLDLTALSTGLGEKDINSAGPIILRLRQEKNTGIAFILYHSQEGRVSTGQCQISQNN